MSLARDHLVTAAAPKRCAARLARAPRACRRRRHTERRRRPPTRPAPAEIDVEKARERVYRNILRVDVARPELGSLPSNNSAPSKNRRVSMPPGNAIKVDAQDNPSELQGRKAEAMAKNRSQANKTQEDRDSSSSLTGKRQLVEGSSCCSTATRPRAASRAKVDRSNTMALGARSGPAPRRPAQGRTCAWSPGAQHLVPTFVQVRHRVRCLSSTRGLG